MKFIISLFILFILSATAQAAEVDQFTLRQEKLEDSGCAIVKDWITSSCLF